MKTFVRPTSIGLALLNAAMSSKSKLGQQVVSNVLKHEDTNNPIRSGYNRIEHDGIRVSQKTLDNMRKSAQ